MYIQCFSNILKLFQISCCKMDGLFGIRECIRRIVEEYNIDKEYMEAQQKKISKHMKFARCYEDIISRSDLCNKMTSMFHPLITLIAVFRLPDDECVCCNVFKRAKKRESSWMQHEISNNFNSEVWQYLDGTPYVSSKTPFIEYFKKIVKICFISKSQKLKPHDRQRLLY